MIFALQVYLVCSLVGCSLVVLFLKGAGRDFMLDESAVSLAAMLGPEFTLVDGELCHNVGRLEL